MWSAQPGGRVILILGIVLLCSFSGSAQDLQGRFYPEKDSYMVGEPVLFNMEIKNTGEEVVYLNAKNPGKCLDTYEFSVKGSSRSEEHTSELQSRPHLVCRL